MPVPRCSRALQVMSVNARGVFLCLKHQIPLMLETAAGHGAIVITSSVAGETTSVFFNISKLQQTLNPGCDNIQGPASSCPSHTHTHGRDQWISRIAAVHKHTHYMPSPHDVRSAASCSCPVGRARTQVHGLLTYGYGTSQPAPVLPL